MNYTKVKPNFGFSEITIGNVIVYSYRINVKDLPINQQILTKLNIKYSTYNRAINTKKSYKTTPSILIEESFSCPVLSMYFKKRLGIALKTIAQQNLNRKYQWINNI